ncbi:MAG: hypothetical protein WC716_12450 [Chitinophagaceae bacterium]|jgi:hypothetical protein
MKINSENFEQQKLSILLVNLYNDATDKYEFGYNGQMKVNEVAGVGNWNTAEFWEYNTRTGVRANRDPKVNTWESPYNTFNANPIWKSDPNGDYSRIGAWRRNILWGGDGIAKVKEGAEKGEWGVKHHGQGVDGDFESVFQTQGARHKFMGDYRQEMKEEIDNHRQLSDFYKSSSGGRNLDRDVETGFVSDRLMTNNDKLKAILDQIGIASFTAAPNLAPPVSSSNLSNEIAQTFQYSRYTEVTLSKPITLARYYDNVGAFAKGRFMTNSTSSFTFYDRVGLAIKPGWNQMSKVAHWEIPAGTTLYKGKAAMQFPWVGGKTQYFVPELSNLKRVIK